MHRFIYKIVYKIVLIFLSNLTKKNKKFKNILNGKDLYIVGNGASLKYYDLKVLKDKNVMTSNALFFHKDFKYLSSIFYVIGHPGIFFSYWKHQYLKKITKNLLGLNYKEKMSKFKDKNITYFTPLINSLSALPFNINYLYSKSNKTLSYDASNNFNFNAGSLSYMLGLAAYMKPDKIYLISVDYTMNPELSGHFFDNHEEVGNKYSGWSSKYIKKVMETIPIYQVIPNDSFTASCGMKPVFYEKLFGKKISKKENYEIISFKDIEKMKKWNIPFHF